ncbi:MAG: diaminopimelate epimerase [Zetaproteobacteria bacterium]|nr:MAG: diaminopimelate epimerase [Zetaproteobacteria bacterium]
MVAQGNDFVIIDGRGQSLPEFGAEQVRRCCDRRWGVGCDQLLLLAAHPRADAAMRIFNRDGSEAGNCGNGARCAADWLMRVDGRARVRIALADRTIEAWRDGEAVTAEMGDARLLDCDAHHCDVDLGNRHRVCFDAAAQFDPAWNCEMITGSGEGSLWIEVVERGAGRTPACGTGACAAAVAWWARTGRAAPLRVVMPGGAVEVSGTPEALRLRGPVVEVFHGVLSVDSLDRSVSPTRSVHGTCGARSME